MSKTNYFYDHNNRIFASKTVYVVTTSVDGGQEHPVACYPTEQEADRTVRSYAAEAMTDYDDDGNAIERTVSARYYALELENDDLWLGEKLTGHLINIGSDLLMRVKHGCRTLCGLKGVKLNARKS